MEMKHVLIFGFAAVALQASAVGISFNGQSRDIMVLDAERSTGLDHIYVAYDASELTGMVVTGASGPLSIQKYSNLGGGYAQPVAVRQSSEGFVVDNPEGNMGYIITDGTTPTYIWLVDYATQRFSIDAVEAYPEQECNTTRLHVSGTGPAIHYYSIDGRQCELSRKIKSVYNTLVWDEELNDYRQTSETSVFAHLSDPLTISPAIFCNTHVTVSGDRFLEHWHVGASAVSPAIIANGVECHTEAEQTNVAEIDPEGPGSNVIKTETEGLGGSAPADISFRAFTTDAVIHHEWQMASDADFEYITNRYNQQDLDYSFTEEGTYYVRYVGSNNDGSCETVGDTYTISIGASELRIPNAFSPNDDGVNDEWKVGYRSLLSFKCWIFDRYGNQLFHFEDPSLGWDGTYRGKKVRSGVYYYVIEAEGADGRKYKQGGDINIIDYKRAGSSTADGGTEPSK